MSEKTRRRFWQIHLSTAVLSTLLAGTLIGLNLHGRTGPMVETYLPDEGPVVITFEAAKEYFATHDSLGDVATQATSYGWPLRTIDVERDYRLGETTWQPGMDWGFQNFDRLALAVDITVGMAILLGVAALTEYALRRREAQRTITGTAKNAPN